MDTEGSEYDRLFYPYLFEGGAVNAQEVLAQVRHSTLQKCHEVITLRQATLARFKKQIVAAGKAMAEAFAAGATLFAFGNGGSATDAHDLVSDLVHPAFSGQAPQSAARPLPAVALTHDIAVITAVGNDVGFENIFARQLIAFGRRGDIAFGISTSGNSTNLLQAFAQAKQQGLLTIALVGYDGGKMAHTANVDYCIIAPSDHIPRIQEAQATTYHALIEIVHTLIRTQNTTEKDKCYEIC